MKWCHTVHLVQKNKKKKAKKELSLRLQIDSLTLYCSGDLGIFFGEG